ncbi:MAG: tRNA dihydrouridine(20/20a) synthase DusA [Burkholderiales bacterium]|nr:tRNA dihydrouridine(20/20a) synthase DusA [Burkholderiales bacterium]
MKKVAIAPMLDWTDRHYRYFMRQITDDTELYTEMIVVDAILHGNLERLLGFSFDEQPVAVQLGGSSPYKLAKASKICQQYGYNAINLNVGCPSDRVKSGNFGACLMRDVALVADCIKAMQDAVTIPVTIKHRVGLDYNDSYSEFYDFVAKIIEINCTDFIIHARNAVLQGLSPKENRDIPPLKYDFVYRLKSELPHVNIMINGGIKTISEITDHLKYVDGVMIGREAYYNPYLFSQIDNLFFARNCLQKSRKQVAEIMIPYLEQMSKLGIPLHRITRHMIGLYHGCANAKIWRHTLSQEILKTNSIHTYIELLNVMDIYGL